MLKILGYAYSADVSNSAKLISNVFIMPNCWCVAINSVAFQFTTAVISSQGADN